MMFDIGLVLLEISKGRGSNRPHSLKKTTFKKPSLIRVKGFAGPVLIKTYTIPHSWIFYKIIPDKL